MGRQLRVAVLGIAHARGELLAFTDSDCVPARDWLERLRAAFEDPAIGLVGGPAGYKGAATLGGRCANFLMMTSLGGGGACDPRSVLHVRFEPRSYNLAVRRELALAAGGFPPTFYGEEIEFGQRVVELGAGVAFLPEAMVTHDERRSVWQTAVASFKKGHNRAEQARRCGMHNVLYAAPSVLVAICAVWLTLFVARSPLAMWAAMPLLLYGAAMLGLGFYGGFAMREAWAGAALPGYAVLIHAAYGIGYALGMVRLVVECARQPEGGVTKTKSRVVATGSAVDDSDKKMGDKKMMREGAWRWMAAWLDDRRQWLKCFCPSFFCPNARSRKNASRGAQKRHVQSTEGVHRGLGEEGAGRNATGPRGHPVPYRADGTGESAGTLPRRGTVAAHTRTEG